MRAEEEAKSIIKACPSWRGHALSPAVGLGWQGLKRASRAHFADGQGFQVPQPYTYCARRTMIYIGCILFSRTSHMAHAMPAQLTSRPLRRSLHLARA